MTYTVSKPTIKRIYRGQSGFNMIDGVKLVPRAAIEILEQCPSNMRGQIEWAIAKGWIQPVAYVRDDELVWDKLTNNS
jgi:hypothetical protein